MKKIVPVFPWPMHPKTAEYMAAIPDIEPVEALPGGPGPVLAVRDLPPFICDALVVTHPDRLVDAVNVITSRGIEWVNMAQRLGGKELPSEKVESKVRFQ